ncbi:MAG: fatty acid desaturase [Acaryochloridaceae cyanobacterium SU_2_1]|nr:fatty acid desaturase [Acaryochloridaceae cyanobacterium SU_2_1]
MQDSIGVEARDSNVSPSKDLPFTLQDIKSAIPPDCFEPSLWRSIAYFCLDIGIIAGLYGIAHQINAWWFWPIFWVAQGTMFWALFVVGHDCGHRSFAKQRWVNDLFGHLSHTPILVPFHGWRISHRTHHANTGNLQTDESWYPPTESEYRSMPQEVRFVRYYLTLFAYPIYLFMRSPGRKGSHFLPSSPLFRPSEKWDVITSTVLWSLMVVGLAGLTYSYGFLFLLKYYLGGYIVFVVWLDLVTLLHHTVPSIPWYPDKHWYFLKGALSTIDHDYGFINPIHHNIGTHVAHHIFLGMPHYHLLTATAAIKPILGEYYRKSEDPIWKSLWIALRNCHFVPDQGEQVYYQADRPS